MRLPSDRDLAAMMGIAPMTLRQAVGKLVDDGVLERQHRVGTFVRKAESMPNIALLVFNMSHLGDDNLSGPALKAIGKIAEKENRQVRALLMQLPFRSPTEIYDELRAAQVGAVGLQGFLNTDREFIRSLSEHLPCVLFSKGISGLNLPCATHDTFAMARTLVEYFTGRNRSKISMVGFSSDHQMHKEIAYGVQAELARIGLNADKQFWYENTGYPKSDEPRNIWLRRTLMSDNRPDAMIVSTSTIAGQIALILDERGEKIGRELDVIPLHSFRNGTASDAPWPVMCYDEHAAITAAAGMLEDVLEGRLDPGAAPVVRVAPELTVGSVD